MSIIHLMSFGTAVTAQDISWSTARSTAEVQQKKFSSGTQLQRSLHPCLKESALNMLEGKTFTWWFFDLFWSFNCALWGSEQLDIIFHAILPTKIIPLLVHSPHWSYFISQVPSVSHWLLVPWKWTVKQLVFEQLPASTPTCRLLACFPRQWVLHL